VGIAIAQEAGLALPAILDCGDKTLSQISAASKDLVARANSGALHPEEYTGGTFSISNMGMFNVTSFVAIIHPPNAAVLAVGRVVKKPVVKDDELEIAKMMTVTLSADHRVVDGAEGAQFVMEVKRLLENPLGLLV
jgi:pyruvate dehydrogenase E2 component (dihydrolipoamide acetyltransferase)